MSVLDFKSVRGSSVNALLGVPRQPRAGAFFLVRRDTVASISPLIYTPLTAKAVELYIKYNLCVYSVVNFIHQAISISVKTRSFRIRINGKLRRPFPPIANMRIEIAALAIYYTGTLDLSYEVVHIYR